MSSRPRPVLSVQRVPHVPTHPVSHLLASNKSVVVVMANKRVHFVDKQEEDEEEAIVDISRFAAKVLAAFIDPSGQFVVLNVAQNGSHDTLYLHKMNTSGNNRVVVSNRLKGHVITAVTFHTQSKLSSNVCGPLLMATKQGLVFELELSFGMERLFAASASVTETYCRQMFCFDNECITGLAITPLDNDNKSSLEFKIKFIILVSTAQGNLYELKSYLTSMEERPLFTALFEAPLKRLKQKEITATNPKSSNVITSRTIDLALRTKENGKTPALLPLQAEKCVWMVGNEGLYHFDMNSKDRYLDNQDDGNWVDFSSLSSSTFPSHFCVTRFHAVLVYPPNVLRVLCLLDRNIHFEAELPDLTSVIKGVVRDDITGSIFAFADYSVHRLVINKEERLVWKICLDNNDFHAAEEYALDDADRIEATFLKRAEYLFRNKKFEESAKYFGLVSSLSFEETALKFVRSREKEAAVALVSLLRHKLDSLRAEDKTQLTLITAWLVEIYLGKLDKTNPKWRRELIDLLSQPKLKSCLRDNRSVFLKLMSAHDDLDDDDTNKAVLIDFARLLQDKQLQVELLLRKADYDGVLKLVRSEPKLIYTYGAELVQNRAPQFVDTLISMGQKVEPVKLIPSLTATTSVDKLILTEVIRYLEFCVDQLQSKQTAVHNYLVALYIEIGECDRLDQYFDSHLEPVVSTNYDCSDNNEEDYSDDYEMRTKPKKIADTLLDLKYALRLCEEKELHAQSVRLYCALGQLEEGVELALTFDQQLAEDCVKSHVAKNDLETRRKLWMQIARYVIKSNNNSIEEAVSCLNRSEGLVHIEDVLQFFPDFETIGPFKTIVCDALREYNDQIETMKQEMEASSRSADLIRSEMEELKNEAVVIKSKTTCVICKTLLMRKQFHVFPCGHHIHSDCLMNEAPKIMDNSLRRRLMQLRQKLRRIESGEQGNEELIRDEIDHIVASECVVCGDRVIDCVDKPFIESNNFDQVMSEWL